MYSAPRGTADILPEEQPYWDYIRQNLERMCRLYGFERIDVPIFELAELYVRGSGDATDIVRKEMYLFEDRGGEQMALRPEMTPNVVRAYLQHGMFNLPQPVKLFYAGPAFRYERPQSGRYRQFVQFGLEALGEEAPALDSEVIEHAWRLYESMGLRDLILQINTIGDPACRPAYIERLRDYYRDKLDQVCRDCRERFERNPLRLLDCKVPSCQPIIAGAPSLTDSLCDPCREHFAALLAYLEAEQIPYEINRRLVRGLDYYTRTVFEIMPQDAGSQGTIGAGGRYDGLVEILGGRPTPAVGYASGFERVTLNLKKQGVAIPAAPRAQVYILHETEDPALLDQIATKAVALTSQLRRAGVIALQSYGQRSLKSQMRTAGRSGARFALILGDEEFRTGTVLLRNLETSEQQRLPEEETLRRLNPAID